MTAIAVGGCSSGNTSSDSSAEQQSDEAVATANVATFNADSAYQFVKSQCEFGPRVPNTEAHRKCGAWLEQELKRHCESVSVQNAMVTAFDGTKLECQNIVGVINPDAQKRLLLLAHWDSRPWADEDENVANRKKPVMGANDGASGVGVLLELARVLKQTPPTIGIDILLVDCEDWGNATGADEDSWALGTQYWAQNPTRSLQSYDAAILLDMVGASGAVFAYEYYSQHSYPGIVNKVWSVAKNSGYGEYFKENGGSAITDDHVFLQKAGVPAIDIIDMQGDGVNPGFFTSWHTTHDTMQNISTATLKAVGQTLATVIAQW